MCARRGKHAEVRRQGPVLTSPKAGSRTSDRITTYLKTACPRGYWWSVWRRAPATDMFPSRLGAWLWLARWRRRFWTGIRTCVEPPAPLGSHSGGIPARTATARTFGCMASRVRTTYSSVSRWPTSASARRPQKHSPDGRKNKAAPVPCMDKACRPHLEETIRILEPSLIILQGKNLRTLISPLVNGKARRVTVRGVDDKTAAPERAEIAGSTTMIASFSHPAARGRLNWGNSARDDYLRDAVVPVINTARKTAGLV